MMTSIDGFEVNIQRKKIKNLHLRVTNDGDIVLSIPMKYPIDDAIEFVKNNEDWIRKRIEYVNSTKIEYIDGETITILGKSVTLRIIISNICSARILNDEVILTITDDDVKIKQFALRKLHSDIVKEIADKFIPKWEEITGLMSSSYQTRYMKTRWGTCNHKTRKIWLSTELAKKPIECIEYVILHEIIHLQIPNHGDEFKELMTEYMPDWKERRRMLKN